jgi:UDP-MurNAc hydroxylase
VNHPSPSLRATSIGHAGIFIETRQATITCDPWFVPAFFGSWFVFPRNDQLSEELLHALTHPDYLYVSHLHGDHFDEPFLAERMDPDTTVLLPAFPTGELEAKFRRLGFHRFIHCPDGEEVDLGDGLRVAIHVETSITDGPGGDSAFVVSDGEHRLVNQNDCRTDDLGALRAHGPVDLHFLQFSGAIWYPMVYDEPPERLRQLIDAKVESQFARAMRYVEALDARFVVPSAGPPCFLDEDLYGFNVITGDELSIFPDQTAFLARLDDAGRSGGVLNIPGTTMSLDDHQMHVEHPMPLAQVLDIFTEKDAYLRRYQADWSAWLTEHRARWHGPSTDLVPRMKRWWEPLMAMAPTLCAAVGGACLIRAGDQPGDPEILVDFLQAQVRPHDGEPYRFRFEIPAHWSRRSWPSRRWTGRTHCSSRAASAPGAKASSTSTCTTSSSRSRWNE